MRELLAGYDRFRAGVSQLQLALFEERAQGQNPKALVIACIDSRVDPAKLFDAAPGEMLVARNVANLVPPYAPDNHHHSTSAALEFGVKVLNVPHIIVLGHSRCGGVHALLEGAPANAQDFIASWMSIATPARTKALQCDAVDERQQICEQEVIRVALDNLMTYPWIKERVDAGQIKLHGAWLDIRTNELMLLQPDNNFVPADQVMLGRTAQSDAGLHAKLPPEVPPLR